VPARQLLGQTDEGIVSLREVKMRDVLDDLAKTRGASMDVREPWTGHDDRMIP
jgi:hypothetical protein